jgi:hypothetical protein
MEMLGFWLGRVRYGGVRGRCKGGLEDVEIDIGKHVAIGKRMSCCND